MKRVLLCRTDALGDLLLTLPVARSLKEAEPDCQITLLVASYTAPLLENEPYIDEVISISGRTPAGAGEFRDLVERLRERDFTAMLCFYPRPSLALAGQLAGVPARIGTKYRWYSPLFSRRAAIHRRQSGKHELELNYELAETYLADLPRYEPELTVGESQRIAARGLLEQQGLIEKKFVIVHPLSAGSAPNWSLSSYFALAELLISAGVQVVLTGTESEAARITEIMPENSTGIHNLAGRTDLPILVGLINLAGAVVCGSTGPIHIATAVRTTAIGIYPPQREISPVRWGPRGGVCKLFLPSAGDQGRTDAELMQTIEPRQVADYLLSELSSGGLLDEKDRSV